MTIVEEVWMNKEDFLKTPIPVNFIATFADELVPVDGQKSKGRLRIFYKGKNRNNSLITDEFVQEFIKTLPGTAVVGEYDKEAEDFTQHTGIEKTRPYGFVPPEMNFAWEKHEDSDGVLREYACCDVVLWTNRYEEAKKIINKKQSMEMDPDSIDGEWEIHDGFPYFKFNKGEFYGLCVLGEDHTPCFEGSGFYGLENDVKELIKTLKTEYVENLKSFSINDLEGGKRMLENEKRINFKLSHSDIFEKLWMAVNPNYNSEGGWLYENGIFNVYDDYALVVNYETDENYRIYYTRGEDDSIVLGEKVEVSIVDVTKDEYSALQYIQSLGTYSEVQSKLELISEFESKNPDFSFDVTEEVVEVEVEGEEDEVEVEEEVDLGFTAEEVELLKAELQELKEYKINQETIEKKEVLATYAERLDEEIISTYTDEVLVSMTKEELEKDLAYNLVKNTDFTTSNKGGNKVPHNEGSKSSLSSVLENYVRD